MNYKNKDVVDKLVKEHSSALVRFLTRRMKSREDAEDIAQAVMMVLASRAGTVFDEITLSPRSRVWKKKGT